MSKSDFVTRNAKALARQCKQVIARELRSYDEMNRKQRITYEQAVQHAVDTGVFPHASRCAHDVPYIEPCEQCERTVEDTHPYIVAASFRLKELLAMLSASPAKK